MSDAVFSTNGCSGEQDRVGPVCGAYSPVREIGSNPEHMPLWRTHSQCHLTPRQDEKTVAYGGDRERVLQEAETPFSKTQR